MPAPSELDVVRGTLDLLLLRTLSWAPMHGLAALRSIRCAEMHFDDVNIWSSPGIAVNENEGEGGNVYRRAA